MRFVEGAVQTRKVNLLAVNEEAGGTRTINLPLDSHLKEITVSISGENPQIWLTDAEGKFVFRNKYKPKVSLTDPEGKFVLRNRYKPKVSLTDPQGKFFLRNRYKPKVSLPEPEDNPMMKCLTDP